MLRLEHIKLSPFDVGEIMHYAGMPKKSLPPAALLECMQEAEPLICNAVSATELPLSFIGRQIRLGELRISSNSLLKCLEGCQSAVIFAATAGLSIDRLIQKYNRIDMQKAVWLQAIGTERVEALCDSFCLLIATEAEQRGQKCLPRFSPGYGDLPLLLQKDIVPLLDCERRLGICLNESLLLSPSKSVTAICGIKNKS